MLNLLLAAPPGFCDWECINEEDANQAFSCQLYFSSKFQRAWFEPVNEEDVLWASSCRLYFSSKFQRAWFVKHWEPWVQRVLALSGFHQGRRLIPSH